MTDLRFVILHMIEETARHLGHLDAARELLDGMLGLGQTTSEADSNPFSLSEIQPPSNGSGTTVVMLTGAPSVGVR
ncbi:MAG: DUF664 domain-containing protein [Mycobacterium sp.]